MNFINLMKSLNNFPFDDESDDNDFIKEQIELECSNEKILVKIPLFVADVLNHFKKRYLTSDNDFNMFIEMSAFEIYKYVNESFQIVLNANKYKVFKKYKLSLKDQNNLFNGIINIVMQLIQDYFEEDEEDEQDDEETID